MRLAIDIGGMSTKICILDKIEIIDRYLIEYKELITAEQLYEKLLPIIEEIIKKYEINYIGLAIPGIIDPESGEVSGISAILEREKINFKVLINQKFKIPVFVENDANCAGIAEMIYGSGKNYQNAAFIIVGTGIGGTIFLNNKIFRGQNFMAGELGCMLNSENDDGIYKNMSSFCGMNALITNYTNESNNKKTGKEIFDLYKSDRFAKKAIDNQIFNLAKLIINTSFVIDPQIFIIGGAVSKNQLFMELLNDKIKNLYEKSGVKQNFTIVSCKFYNDANIIGASVLDI